MLMLIITYLVKNVFLEIVVAPKGYIEWSNIKILIILNFVLKCFSTTLKDFIPTLNLILGFEFYLSTRIIVSELRSKINL